MKVTFFINYLNHHQLPVADEMYKILGDDFHFVATYPRNPEELKGGFDYSDRPYCLLPAERKTDYQKAHQLNIESDVCVFGAGNLDWERERATTDKLSFEISERWFKRGLINILSPRLIKWWWLYQTKLRKKPFYKLCASAFTASDCNKLLTFRNRCFKWGYFTHLPEYSPRLNKTADNIIRIMWCGRLIPLKHADHLIEASHKLINTGYRFAVDIYGDGPCKQALQHLIDSKDLSDIISLRGNISNKDVLDEMRKSEIFVFTSDRKEGWGAVVNEAMSSGCCIVGSDAVGSVPYLISHDVNGLKYRDGNISSLADTLRSLLDNPKKCRELGKQAAIDIREIWSPKRAANNLIQLIDSLLTGKVSIPEGGPCSKA